MLGEPTEWITRLEAARYAHVSTSTISRLVKSGKLTARRIRGTRLVRIDKAALKRLFVPVARGRG